MKSASVNRPIFLLRLSFKDTNAFAIDTREILSSLSLWVFNIDKWLKRPWVIWDQSQVFTLLAVEKERSPLALVAGLTWINLQIVITRSMSCRTSTFSDYMALKMSSKHSISVPFIRTLNVASWARSSTRHTSPWKSLIRDSSSFVVSSPFEALRID